MKKSSESQNNQPPKLKKDLCVAERLKSNCNSQIYSFFPHYFSSSLIFQNKLINKITCLVRNQNSWWRQNLKLSPNNSCWKVSFWAVRTPEGTIKWKDITICLVTNSSTTSKTGIAAGEGTRSEVENGFASFCLPACYFRFTNQPWGWWNSSDNPHPGLTGIVTGDHFSL